MSDDAPHIIDQAIAWHLRQDAMTDADWTAFVAWLEAAAEHARAYDRVATRDRLVGQVVFSTPLAANDDAPAGRRPSWNMGRITGRVMGGAAVAALLAAWFLPLALPKASASQVFATRDGERRNLRLGDGTRIAMNGGTTLRVAADDPRSLTLDEGQVTLRVVHDAARPFTLRTGGQVIRDLGTTFDVARDGGGVSVAVAEGAVRFQPGATSGPSDVRLEAGDALTFASGTGRIVRSSVAAGAVGGWRSGLLGFKDTPLAAVAVSLRRLHGVDVVFAGDLSRRPFTGMIHVTGAADRDIPHLADLIGATWRRDGKTWVLAESATKAR